MESSPLNFQEKELIILTPLSHNFGRLTPDWYLFGIIFFPKSLSFSCNTTVHILDDWGRNHCSSSRYDFVILKKWQNTDCGSIFGNKGKENGKSFVTKAVRKTRTIGEETNFFKWKIFHLKVWRENKKNSHYQKSFYKIDPLNMMGCGGPHKHSCLSFQGKIVIWKKNFYCAPMICLSFFPPYRDTEALDWSSII
jgi:hypothetical protein